MAISDVKIKIESYIENLDDSGLSDGDAEKSVTEHIGRYKFDTVGARLRYSEKDESGAETHSDISVKGDTVSVKRSGGVESLMEFCEGEEHLSVYSVPPYRFDAKIETKRVRLDIGEAGGKIELIYLMTIGGAQKKARMKIWISQP